MVQLIGNRCSLDEFERSWYNTGRFRMVHNDCSGISAGINCVHPRSYNGGLLPIRLPICNSKVFIFFFLPIRNSELMDKTRYNYLIMAIVLSNFAKPFLLLTMIWSYGFDFNQLINSFILASNAVAVKGIVAI